MFSACFDYRFSFYAKQRKKEAVFLGVTCKMLLHKKPDVGGLNPFKPMFGKDCKINNIYTAGFIHIRPAAIIITCGATA